VTQISAAEGAEYIMRTCLFRTHCSRGESAAYSQYSQQRSALVTSVSVRECSEYR
jgi:hypothetical protein